MYELIIIVEYQYEMGRVRYFINLVIVFLILLTVAINRDGRIMGKPVDEIGKKIDDPAKNVIDFVSAEGVRHIESKGIIPGSLGYGGPVYLRMMIENDIIVGVEITENSETPSFLRKMKAVGFFKLWNGQTLDEAITSPIDAVSGATLTSHAVINTMRKMAAYAASVPPVKINHSYFTLKNIIGMLVVVSSLIMIFFPFKTKQWRLLQLLLNVLVLGFWCGSFLSLSLLVNWLSNGVNMAIALIPIILLTLSIILPFFDKKLSYCAWQCPMGSLQEILGKSCNKKLMIPLKIEKVLIYTRDIILLLLLFFMWIGVGFEIMDYEVFTAFLFTNASTAVLILAGVFLLLSLFVNRPYCRYICPTGALIKMSQNTQQFKNKSSV